MSDKNQCADYANTGIGVAVKSIPLQDSKAPALKGATVPAGVPTEKRN